MPSRDAVAGVSRAAAHAIWMVSKKTRNARLHPESLGGLTSNASCGASLTSLTGVPT